MATDEGRAHLRRIALESYHRRATPEAKAAQAEDYRLLYRLCDEKRKAILKRQNERRARVYGRVVRCRGQSVKYGRCRNYTRNQSGFCRCHVRAASLRAAGKGRAA